MKIRNIRSVQSLLTEDFLLTAGAYLAFAAYSAGAISYAGLFALVLLYVIRVFNLRHERAHLPYNNLSPMLKRASAWLEVYHTPWQEPFAEKRRKHLLHHQGHSGKNTPASVIGNDHHHLEASFVHALFSSAFYHELMFFLDLRRERRISAERMQSFVISSLAIGITIAIGGWQNFLAFFVAFRVASLVTWFTFSYVLHIDELYQEEVGAHMPPALKQGIEYVLGQGSVTAIFYHQFHHRRPNQFYTF